MSRLIERSAIAVVALLLASGGFAGTRFADSLFAAGNEHRIIVGLATTDALVTKWWHTEGQSLDLIKTDPKAQTFNASVYWQSWRQSGTGVLTMTVLAHTQSCKQTRVSVKAGATLLGTYWFKHVDNSPMEGTSWTSGSSWTIRLVGTVIGGEPDARCQFTAVHLHQGGSPAGAAPTLSHNTGLQSQALVNGACDTWHPPGTKCRITPTGDPTNKWTHRVVW